MEWVQKMPTDKALADGLVANELPVFILWVTVSNKMMNGLQVQVDSVVQIERQSPILRNRNSLHPVSLITLKKTTITTISDY